MKHPVNKWPHFLTLGLIYGTGALTLIYMLAFMNTMPMTKVSSAVAPAAGSACGRIAGIKTITISHDGFSPQNLTVPICTELIFVNIEKGLHLPAFGDHEHHDHTLPYTEKVLGLGQTNSVILNRAGLIQFHDHLNDQLTGQVIVKQ